MTNLRVITRSTKHRQRELGNYILKLTESHFLKARLPLRYFYNKRLNGKRKLFGQLHKQSFKRQRIIYTCSNSQKQSSKLVSAAPCNRRDDSGILSTLSLKLTRFLFGLYIDKSKSFFGQFKGVQLTIILLEHSRSCSCLKKQAHTALHTIY